MFRTVVREYHWSPAIVGDFYIDDMDVEGLEFWYNDIIEMHEAIKKEIKPAK
jgi:hypothetical protein